jgi:predicted unusual protein kinase regulating ubiquinone biosynthesis (AarF/ABC1/UbiB family)
MLPAVESKDEEVHRLVLVDAGMVAELTQKEQRNFIGLLASFGEGDGETAAKHLLDLSAAGPQQYSPATRLGFTKDVKELFSRLCRGYGTGTDVGEAFLSCVRHRE